MSFTYTSFVDAILCQARVPCACCLSGDDVPVANPVLDESGNFLLVPPLSQHHNSTKNHAHHQHITLHCNAHSVLALQATMCLCAHTCAVMSSA
jgi:hypothetical protein